MDQGGRRSLETAALKAELDDLQRRLYAEHTRSVLFVLQAMDAAGKDGTVRAVFSGFNPAGVRVTSFKAPAGAELEHDYLWRCHAATPRAGEIAVWNRSHYEDVLVVRVKEFVPRGALEEALRTHPRLRADALRRGHHDRQALPAHLQGRAARAVAEPCRRSRPTAGSSTLPTSANATGGTAYMKAFSDAISETSTAERPWYAIPADRKWVRNLAVAKVVHHTLHVAEAPLSGPPDGIVGTVVR